MGDDTIKKNISKNIAKYRESAGLSQKDLANKLGVVPSRISNWETGANCPTIDILFDVCEVLDVSINDIYGVYPDSKFVLKYGEQDLLKKYRALDEHGKKMVDFVLAEESDRCSASIDHFRGDFMDGIQTWPADLAKVPSNRISIPNDTAWLSAAHNDHASDPEEQEKMQTDMKLLKRPEK